MKYDYLIVGAGFSGSVLAERLANVLNKKVLIVEKRNHIGGNAYDEFDEHGIMIHRYGPHVFHTNSKIVFDYLSQFTKWKKYEHKVAANLNGELYPLPINRLTINKLYRLNLQTDEQVRLFYESVREKREPILNSEDVIVNQVGKDLFEKFFKNYTVKQWNHAPKELSPSVCGRVPIRVNNDCRYFTDEYQFMPSDGFTKMFEKMLANKNIEIVLNTDYRDIVDDIEYDKMIYTGPIDYFFDYEFGKLPYRSIRFVFETINKVKAQDYAVINFVDTIPKFTRVTEYKYFTGQISTRTTISKEYSQLSGEDYYPILTETNKRLFLKYLNEAAKEKKVIFHGRLTEYKYYNMDQTVANSLNLFSKMI